MPLPSAQQSDPLADLFANEQVLEGGDEQQQEEQDDGLSQIDPEILKQAKQLGSTEAYQELLKDPEFQALYNAKKSGRKVSISVAEQQQQQEITLPENFKDMTPQQVLAALIPQVKQSLASEFEPIKQQAASMQQFVAQQKMAEATQDIQQARQQFADFDDHAPEITKLAGENPTLNAKELYAIARIRKGTLKPGGPRPTSTELPASQQHRPQSRVQANKPVAPQQQLDPAQARRQVFESAFSKAIANFPNFGTD